MMRSLYSGVTGLRNHQTRMDIIGNNIANVNTVGYKSSRVIFQDIYSQTLKPASGSNGVINGGTNPQQIGLGSTLATIDVMHTRSAAQYTGNALDLSVEGDGYFVLSDGGKLTYTRAGNLYTDVDDNLVNANGLFVQGLIQNADGTEGPGLANININPLYYDVTIDKNGAVMGLARADNTKHKIGQMVLATFGNQNALEKVGQNMYRATANSGTLTNSIPGTGGAGQLNPGTLEMSNVDLAQEFTDMIVTQRGFQANSRIITTTDQMLEELVNLKR
jgi:flagellar hook protein FlgE